MILFPLIYSFLFKEFLGKGFSFWFTKNIIFGLIPVVLLSIALTEYLGKEDTLLKLSIFMLIGILLGSIYLSILEEIIEDTVPTIVDYFLFFISSVISLLIVVSLIYRISQYPKNVIPELTDIKEQIKSGNIKIDLTDHHMLQDRYFGDILDVLSTIGEMTNITISRLNSLIQILNVGVLLIDFNNKNILSNDEFNKIYTEIKGSDIFQDNVIDESFDIPGSLLLNLDPLPDGKYFFTRVFNGRYIEIEIIINPKFGKILQLTDVTATYESAEVQRRLVETASHQLKSPLTIIKSSLSNYFKYGEKLSPDKKRMLEKKIFEGIDTIDEIVESIIFLRDLESNAITLNYIPVQIYDFMNSLIKPFEHQVEKLKGKLTFSSNIDSSVSFFIDQHCTTRIFEIVIDNAIKYSSLEESKVPIIEISLIFPYNHKKTGILVSVTDNGVGIPEQDRPRVFSKFYRCENVKDFTFGTGLGLSVAQTLIKKVGGDIWFKTEENLGTTFFLFFPSLDPN